MIPGVLPPIISREAGGEAPPPLPDTDTDRVRVEIPADVQALKADRPDLAAAFRSSTRRAFQHYLARGYRVAAYLRDGERRFYGLAAP